MKPKLTETHQNEADEMDQEVDSKDMVITY